MTSISFTANHIKDSQVFRVNQKELTPQKVSFVEFLPTEVGVVNEINHDIGWTGGRRAFDKRSFETGHIYGLTTQTDSFEKINPDKVLGLAITSDDKKVITSIRIRPEARTPIKKTLWEKIVSVDLYDYYKGKREYKKVGTAILDGLKSACDDIAVFSPKKYVEFFVKNGFSNPLPKDRKYLTWIKK